ncbi:MarR family transcriptional regulator [Nocardia sp. NPDC004068]|uniref:MarR family transcriptional regulator n=1 Tax=Nocardia sp. NPDC004068 TaxID=3364303 RepID=UPI0036851EED
MGNSLREYDPRDFTPSQVNAVVALGRAGKPQTIEQLAKVGNQRTHAVRSTVNWLVARGLVERWFRSGPGVGTDPERWMLTASGHSLFRTLGAYLPAQAARRRGHQR